MSRNFSAARRSVAIFGLSLAVAGGCASDSKPVDAPPPASRAGESSAKSAAAAPGRPSAVDAAPMHEFQAALVQNQKQIDSTLAALTALTDPAQPDLRGAFSQYRDQLARLRQQSEAIKREADNMRAAREKYFGAWEERLDEIDSPTIRASAEGRRKRLRDAHEQIATASGAARDAYAPFMKDLEEIRKYLETELTAASVADLQDASAKVRASGTVVRGKIDVILQVLNKVQASG